jgi:hypothetical protein
MAFCLAGDSDNMKQVIVLILTSLSCLANSYSTSFPLTDNPVSEGGNWQTTGWNMTSGPNNPTMRTTPGLAFGNWTSGGRTDAIAILGGTWGSAQSASGVVHVVIDPGSDTHEVELHLLMSLCSYGAGGTGWCGYEVDCSIASQFSYLELHSWSPSGAPTLASNGNRCANGDTLEADVDSTGVITVRINGVVQFTHNTSGDSPKYTSGNPGIGTWNTNSSNVYGFSSFSASDGSSSGSGFSLAASPSNVTVLPGATANYTASVSSTGGFTGTVNLTISGQPTGASASFSPSSITTSGISNLTVTTAATTSTGIYTLTITGVSAGVTQTADVVLAVNGVGGVSSACDLNNDGATNVVDLQIAVNRYLSCTVGPNVSSQSFISQVTTGALGGACSRSAGAYTVFLNWPTGASAVGYYVYRATTSGSYTTPLNSSPTSGTSFSDCTVTPGVTYYYVIRSVDSSGNQSANSSEIVVSVPA